MLRSERLALNYPALIPDVINGIDPRKYNIQYVITMGDKCQWEAIKTWLQTGIAVFDGYGPTEATIAATLRQLTLDTPAGIVALSADKLHLEGVLPEVKFILINTDYIKL